MVKATAPSLGVTQVYTYPLERGLRNGDGLRVAESVNGEERRFTWDEALALPQVLATSDGVQHLYGLGRIGVEQSNTWSYQHTDPLGSVRQWSNAAGSVIGERSYSPFGVPVRQQGSQPAPWGFIVAEPVAVNLLLSFKCLART